MDPGLGSTYETIKYSAKLKHSLMLVLNSLKFIRLEHEQRQYDYDDFRNFFNMYHMQSIYEHAYKYIAH